MFNADFGSILLRYYLMMAVIIAGLFTGQIWLAALGLPVFILCITGYKFGRNKKQHASSRVELGEMRMKKAS